MRKIKHLATATQGKRIHAGAPPEDRSLRFSFRYLDTTQAKFDCTCRDASYFTTLLARMKDVCGMDVQEFRTRGSKGTLRIHQINFRESRVSENGFGIPKGEEYDDEAWQFALSSNEHGRVHGFLIDTVFFVRWLDPDHQLYPGQG